MPKEKITKGEVNDLANRVKSGERLDASDPTVAKEVPEAQPQKTVSKRQVMICPSCHAKNYEKNGRDGASTWCVRCGRAFIVNWQEE